MWLGFEDRRLRLLHCELSGYLLLSSDRFGDAHYALK